VSLGDVSTARTVPESESVEDVLPADELPLEELPPVEPSPVEPPPDEPPLDVSAPDASPPSVLPLDVPPLDGSPLDLSWGVVSPLGAFPEESVPVGDEEGSVEGPVVLGVPLATLPPPWRK
jgi:hypothetical protein